MRQYVLIALCVLFRTNAQKFINTSAILPNNADTLCTQPGLVGEYMCVMNSGISSDRNYSNEILLAGRDVINSTTSYGFTSKAISSFRPDITIYATHETSTLTNSITGTAVANLDMFVCSEETCNNYVDLKYVGYGESYDIGFAVGVIPYTNLAIGVPLRTSSSNTACVEVVSDVVKKYKNVDSAFRFTHYVNTDTEIVKGYAMLGTRVNFEAYTDYLLSKSSFGVAPYSINGVCAYIIYPDNAWYMQYIISKFTKCSEPNHTFAMMGISNNNWCYFCDTSSIDVSNHNAGCYPSNLGTCENHPYPFVDATIDTWKMRIYNLTSNNSNGDQSLYLHPWSTILMEIIENGRNANSAGCNKTDGFICVGNGCTTLLPEVLTCPAAEMTFKNSNGYGALVHILRNYWVTTLQWKDADTFSMLGNERLTVSRMKPEIDAAEQWGYQQASISVRNSIDLYKPMYNVKGYLITFMINAAAAFGAWSAYPNVAAWISKIASIIIKHDKINYIIGKSVAGVVTMAITVMPLITIVITDNLINKDNINNKSSITYMQQAFDAPGYGKYKIVIIAQINKIAGSSHLSLNMGIPLICVMFFIGITAIVLTEVAIYSKLKSDKLASSDRRVKVKLIVDHTEDCNK